MKNFVIILSLLLFISCFAGITSAADITAQTGYNFDWWKDSKGNSGSQSFIPLKISTRIQDFSFSVLTGYADTHNDPDAKESRSLSNMLDTKINTSYEITGKLPVDILIGLDFNLPTGKTDLKQKNLSVIMDPDLVSITNFGEGFNINPSLTIAKEWDKLVAGIGFGYVWRGEYDYSENARNYDPGDIFITTAEVRYYFLPEWNARIFGNYVIYTKDQIKDNNFYKEGDLILGGLGIYTDRSNWNGGLTFRTIFRNKSKFPDASGELSTEDNNSHGTEYTGDLFFRYMVSDKFILNSSLQGLLITANDYSENSSFFVGQREKYTLGVGGTMLFNRNIQANLFLKGFTMHDNGAEFPEHLSARNYQGFSASLFLTAKF
jgi:hypothetical protein